MRINWSPLALERITDIADFISQDKPKAALNWIDSVFDSIDKISSFPKNGRIAPEVNREDIRETFVGDSRVIFRLQKKQISVLTVRHGKQLLSTKNLHK
jgi:toxin ParE1/3/4